MEEVDEIDMPETDEVAAPVEAPRKGKLVKIRITKFGDGKVSTGVHIASQGDVKAAHGDVLKVSREVAEMLEARALGEIV